MKLSGSSRKRIIKEVAIILMIAFSAFKLTWGLENIRDIGLADESNYLYRGVNLMRDGLPAAENSPLYSIWYFLLSLFQKNNESLYYLNLKLMTILFPLALLFALRALKRKYLVSMAMSFFIVISFCNLPVWPKPVHFALIILLISFGIAAYVKSHLRVIFVFAIGTLLASFVRPEFFLSFIIFAVLYVLFLLRSLKKHGISRELVFLLIFLVLSTVIIGALGFPFGGNRSWIAFGQHYALNHMRWENMSVNSWTNYKTITHDVFGDSKNMIEAFLANPGRFSRHVFSNIKNAAINTIGVYFSHYNLLLSPSDQFNNAIEGLLLIFFLLGLGIYYRRNLKNNYKRSLEDKKVRLFAILTATLILPGLISAILIYPRYHYLLSIMILLSVIVAIVLTGTDNGSGESIKRILITALVLFAVTPFISGNWYFANRHGNAPLKNRDTIRFIKKLDIKENVYLLEAEGGFHIYLGHNFHRVRENSKKKNENFNSFLINNRINMIVLSDKLLTDNRFKDDPQWKYFLNNFSLYGFSKYNIPNSQRILLVKEGEN